MYLGGILRFWRLLTVCCTWKYSVCLIAWFKLVYYWWLLGIVSVVVVAFVSEFLFFPLPEQLLTHDESITISTIRTRITATSLSYLTLYLFDTLSLLRFLRLSPLVIKRNRSLKIIRFLSAVPKVLPVLYHCTKKCEKCRNQLLLSIISQFFVLVKCFFYFLH